MFLDILELKVKYKNSKKNGCKIALENCQKKKRIYFKSSTIFDGFGSLLNPSYLFH